MSMTKDEAIKQIEKLKSYCEYMADSDESGAYLFDLMDEIKRAMLGDKEAAERMKEE